MESKIIKLLIFKYCICSLRDELAKFPQYYSGDVDLYSLEDLVHLRFSTGAPMKTKDFVAEAIKHVLNCEVT